MDTRSFLVRALVLTLMACGGTATISIDPDGGSSSGGSSGGGSSGSSGSSGGSCSTATLPGDMACVPGTARAGQAIRVDVGSSDGCFGCFSTYEACDVSVNGSEVRIAMKVKTCPPDGVGACPTVCTDVRTQCTIPPLRAGTYTVRVDGEKGTGRHARTLVVSADSSASASCNLLANGQTPKPIGPYGAACNEDEDCVAATVGDVCQVCACPNAAIATSEVPRYEADTRERASQCRPVQAPPCAACRAPTAICLKPTDGKGMCILQPIR
jgi:hypothetical protein